jgi:hypothetical protein
VKKILKAVCPVFALAVSLCAPQGHAANIITFDDNANACGGSVMCSTNGTTGYSGTMAFNLSTLSQWFQIDTDGMSHLAGQPVEPLGGAGGFLVVNNTGSIVTSYSITLTDTFTSSTPSVNCSGGVCVDNFQANKGAAAPAGSGEGLSGADFSKCTNGAAGQGFPCFSTGGQAAADFTNKSPQSVTYNWVGLDIAPGTDFLITFASWNNTAFVSGSTTSSTTSTTSSSTPIPEPGSIVLLGSIIMVTSVALRKKLARRS